MIRLQGFVDWLNIRSDELRSISISVAGSFLIISVVTLGRALREGLYLGAFDVDTLPFIMAASVLVSFPAASGFSKLLSGHSPVRVVRGVGLAFMVGLLLLWPFATRSQTAIVLFYLWTTIGALLLTSGFWVVTAEYFAVRGAKRLYGLIGAGGTAGALVTGASLTWLTRQISLAWLIPLLGALLLLFLLVQAFLPPRRDPTASKETESNSAGNEGRARNVALDHLFRIGRHPHLRTIAALVFIATLSSTLVDYMFKEHAQARYGTEAGLTAFFGSFYAWTGAIALLIQLLVASRLVTTIGVGRSLAVLPALSVVGSALFLGLPGFTLATALRGTDASLRRSLYRQLIEFLYVPIPVDLRRRTKTFIDSVIDSIGEGVGAAIIFLWVTLAHFPSRFLAVFVIVLATLLLLLSQRMGRSYFQSIVERLRQGEAEAEEMVAGSNLHERDLLSATFTQLDLQSLEVEAKAASTRSTEPRARIENTDHEPERLLTALRSPDRQIVIAAIEGIEASDGLDERHVEAVARLLARESLYGSALACLVRLGERSVPVLAKAVTDRDGDFVIRRRIPAVLAQVDTAAADAALLSALHTNRFEIRYRAAVALSRRRKDQMAESEQDWRKIIWEAIRFEVRRDRPVWELQRLLDDFDAPDDDLVTEHVGSRGALSLEHTFRLLGLVLDREPVRASFRGVLMDDENLKGYALEYMEQVLPKDIRDRLWPFIGDVSEHRRTRSARSINQVVSDLMTTHATLFSSGFDLRKLSDMLEERDDQSG